MLFDNFTVKQDKKADAIESFYSKKISRNIMKADFCIASFFYK